MKVSVSCWLTAQNFSFLNLHHLIANGSPTGSTASPFDMRLLSLSKGAKHVGSIDLFLQEIIIFLCSLKLMLLPQERVEADKSYWGEYDKVDLPYKGLLKKSTSLQKYAKTRIWARNETFDGRCKQFNCLKNVWRHDLEKHKMTFRSVAALVQ